jgi:hypothetical protein
MVLSKAATNIRSVFVSGHTDPHVVDAEEEEEGEEQIGLCAS